MPRPPARTSEPEAKKTDTWYTRGEAANILHCSKATVKRCDGRLLHPVLDDAGCHRYAPAEVHALRFKNRRKLEAKELPQASDGEIAAAAFHMFGAGNTRAEVVVALSITPERVDDLWDSYSIGSYEEAARRRRVDQARKTAEQQQAAEAEDRRKRRDDAAKRHEGVMAGIFATTKEPRR